jgi:hypothetical protein
MSEPHRSEATAKNHGGACTSAAIMSGATERRPAGLSERSRSAKKTMPIRTAGASQTTTLTRLNVVMSKGRSPG